jgi:hypothetical protein
MYAHLLALLHVYMCPLCPVPFISTTCMLTLTAAYHTAHPSKTQPLLLLLQLPMTLLHLVAVHDGILCDLRVCCRGERLRELCGQLGLDAILLITGWDGCHNLGSRSLVEWLCDKAGSSTSAAELEDIYEEGLFVITPNHIEWCITHMADDVHMDDAAADAAADAMQMSPHASCEPCGMQIAAATAPSGSCCGTSGCSSNSTAMDGMSLSASAGAALMMASPAAAAAAAAVPASITAAAAPAPDGKLTLLMHLRASMGRVGVPLGVEVLHGTQHQVDTATIYQ